MVVSVSHLTHEVEIGGGGHAPILSVARGPAPPPSAGPHPPNPNTNPTLSPASGSCISTRPGGYDDPFLFHWPPFLDSSREQAYNHRFVERAIVGPWGPDYG